MEGTGLEGEGEERERVDKAIQFLGQKHQKRHKSQQEQRGQRLKFSLSVVGVELSILVFFCKTHQSLKSKVVSVH